jgi:hypothetical protein
VMAELTREERAYRRSSCVSVPPLPLHSATMASAIGPS